MVSINQDLASFIFRKERERGRGERDCITQGKNDGVIYLENTTIKLKSFHRGKKRNKL
jgi:hypothetical protein